MATQVGRAPCLDTNAQWRILVVDDEEQCVELYGTVLRKEGYSVDTARSGVEALAKLRERPFDLVISDMVMPQMDGMQLLANVKEMYPETDVIVMSGYGTLADAVEAMRRGAADFLPKPFEPRDLKRLTATCLRAKSADQDQAFVAQSMSMIELAQVLARTTEPHALPLKAVELACEKFDADSAILLNYEPAHEGLSVATYAGTPVSSWGRSEGITEQGLEAARQRKICLSADTSSGDCYAYVPMVVADRVRGVLCLRRAGGPWFHEKSVDLLEIFVSHLALSLESAKLYERASEQVADLDEMITTSRSLAVTMQPDEVHKQVLTATSRLIAAEISALLLTGEDEPQLLTWPVVPAGGPLLAAVMEKMLAARGGRSGREARLRRAGGSDEARRQLVSFISAPVSAEDGRYGLLGAFSSRPDGFSVEDARRLSCLAENAATALDNACRITRVTAMYHETIEMLAHAVDSRCAFSAGHSRQVRAYAGEVAKALGLRPSEVDRIKEGALLHDIGKICIPESVLNKPNALSPAEFEIIASHPAYGASMFRNAPHLKDLVGIIRHHHEHWDGSGYPDALKGEEIPLGARIVALGDAFDAVVSHRVYRSAADFDTARSAIEKMAGKQFDPKLSKVFLSLPLEYLVEE